MNIGIRDVNNNMIFVGNTLVRYRKNGDEAQVFKVSFGYFTVEGITNYGVFLADTEENANYSFPFSNGENIKLTNISRL